MRACRPRHGIIPFHEVSRSFKPSRVSFRASLADILTCAEAIKTDKRDYTTFLTNNEDFCAVLTVFRGANILVFCRKIPKRRWRAEHAHRQRVQRLQRFCPFLGVSAKKKAFEINETINAGN